MGVRVGATLRVAPADAVAGDGLSRSSPITATDLNDAVGAGDGDPKACGSVRRLTTAGEACGPELVERFGGLPGVEMFNLYGPSEATVGDGGRPCPARTRRSGVRSTGSPRECSMPGCIRCRAGAAGELYLSGAGLARDIWAGRG